MTLPNAKKKSLVPRRDVIPEVEGSKPALKKFSKWNQRIIADPYPQSNHAPRGQIDHQKVFRSPLYINEKDEYDMLNPYAKRNEQPHPYYDASSRQLVVQNRVAFQNDHYISIERTIPLSVQHASLGLSHAKGIGCQDIPGASPQTRGKNV